MLALNAANNSAPATLHQPEFRPFELASDYQPAGDQPAAIEAIVNGLQGGDRNQVLLGVTGSGKTFTMAHTIAKLNRPTLIMAPNKTLAAQLFGEFKTFFPNNAVEYFVSYYDYYQPEAYVPRSDTFIDKQSQINEQLDRMRHAATRALFERNDVVIIASVSCIYGIGDPRMYLAMTVALSKGQQLNRTDLLNQLISLQYKRNDTDFTRGTFRVRGDTIEVFPAHLDDAAWRLEMFGNELESISEFDPLTGQKTNSFNSVRLYANSHYVTPKPTLAKASEQIKEDLKIRLAEFEADGRLLERQRLEQRTQFDLEMIAAAGVCSGIENYSRYLTGRSPGEAPPTLFEYLPRNALLMVDESHVAVPQIGAMSRGDFARKSVLSEHGFRLPSAIDNRPLKFEEWEGLRPQTLFVSATPGDWEMEQTQGVFVEQVVRPTGLIDPIVEIRPTEHQVDDLLAECRKLIEKNQRVLVTTLTKKMAEALSDYLTEMGIKVRYIHSDVDTIERIEIIRDLRIGIYDVLIGINLLREGLDIPECALVAILDADKEGYLRSRVSLIQTIGRAARNLDGRAILYADRITASMQAAMDETARRRNRQVEYNTANGITPESVKKSLATVLDSIFERGDRVIIDAGVQEGELVGKDLVAYRKDVEKRMLKAAEDLEFEEAARLRDELKRIEQRELGLDTETPWHASARTETAQPRRKGSMSPADFKAKRFTRSGAAGKPSPSKFTGKKR